MLSTEEVAGQLRRAYESQDLEALAPLLAPDVRWGGDEETEQTCHSRGQVLAWFKALRARGVQAKVLDVQVSPDAIALSVEVRPPGAPAFTREQRFRVAGGQIVDIRGGEGAGPD